MGSPVKQLNVQFRSERFPFLLQSSCPDGLFSFSLSSQPLFLPGFFREKMTRITYSGTGVFQAMKLSDRAKKQAGIHCWSSRSLRQ